MNAAERRDARRWSRVAFAALSVAALSVVGNIYQAGLPTKIPYVVSERADGATSTGSELMPAARPDQPWIAYQLGRWIVETRTVSSDPAIASTFADHAALLILGSSPAESFVRAHYAEEPSGGARVIVKINYVRPNNGSDHIMQADWVERTIDPAGRVTAIEHWNAVLTIAFAQGKVSLPSGDDPAYSNPYGMFISDLIWNRENG
jgi:type IV secretory pathway TrbF-like protein